MDMCKKIISFFSQNWCIIMLFAIVSMGIGAFSRNLILLIIGSILIVPYMLGGMYVIFQAICGSRSDDETAYDTDTNIKTNGFKNLRY